MYTYIQKRLIMANTKLFKNGNSKAVRIPAELAYSTPKQAATQALN